MIDTKTQQQIDAFLAELKAMTNGEMVEGDYRPLYAKYPLVRLCIRRAILATRSLTFSS
jgi:hypothetical protein